MAAPKGNKFAVGNKGGGATSTYDSRYCRLAERACQLGFTDRELAQLLGIDESTLNGWKIEHDEFGQVLKTGKSPADERVERALYNRAVGYSYSTEKINVLRDGTVIRTPVVEHCPPDPFSCSLWLRNRRPDVWRDVQQVEHLASALEKLSDDEVTQQMARAAAELAAFERAKKKGNGVAAKEKMN